MTVPPETRNDVRCRTRSRHGCYAVSQVGRYDVDEVRRYVDRVERLLPCLRRVLPDPPPAAPELRASFAGRHKSAYLGGGHIRLSVGLDLDRPETVFGGLFHETVHALLEPYGHARGKWIPEALVVAFQVAAIRRARHEPRSHRWARRYACGHGMSARHVPLLKELLRIEHRHGLAPLQCLVAEMGQQPAGVFESPRRFVTDANSFWSDHAATTAGGRRPAIRIATQER